MDEKIEHIVALTTDLETGLNPIQGGGLKEFCGLKGTKQISTIKITTTKTTINPLNIKN